MNLYKSIAVIGFSALATNGFSDFPKEGRPDYPLSYYLIKVHSHLEKHWKKPAIHPAKFQCQVRIRPDEQGYVKYIKITSCPSGLVSNSVLTAVAQSSPLPMPDEGEEPIKELFFTFAN